LNVPATHAVHASVHGTHAFSAAVRQVGSELHDTHTEALAAEPVPLGHAGHTLRPEKLAYLPAEHAAHAAEPTAEAKVPGAHASHVALSAALENWPAGQGLHVPANL